jgi:hypothetical protein
MGALAMAVAGCAAFAGCSNVAIGSQSFERWQTLSIPAAGLRQLRIVGQNGDVHVTGAPVNAIVVKARIQTNEISQLQSDHADASRSGDAETLATSCPKAHIAIWAVQNCGIDYYVTYPKGLKLAVSEINGDVVIANPASAVTTEVTNGDVTVTQARTDVSAHSHQGDVRATLAHGWSGSAVTLSTTFGDVRLGVPMGFRGTVHAHTTAGDVTGVSNVTPGPAVVNLDTTFGDATVSSP